MIESLKKSFSAYTKNPFLFLWGSIMYVFMLILFFFATLGLLLIYFIFLSVIGQEFDLEAIPTIGFLGIIGLAFVFFANGLNASLAWAYHGALWKEKITLTSFFSYALEKAPQNFAIQLLRDLIWILVAGPLIALYYFVLIDVAYMDWIIGLTVAMITFVIHMIFTPAFVSSGAFDAGLYSSLRHGFNVLRRKHIMFIGLYILFALTWILNFIPFVQIATIFFLYPVVYGALIVMTENSSKSKSGRTKKHYKEEED
ncbi:MAG: hypothetical protein ABH842_00410 [Candidatus Micrarchaeota archaeon]